MQIIHYKCVSDKVLNSLTDSVYSEGIICRELSKRKWRKKMGKLLYREKKIKAKRGKSEQKRRDQLRSSQPSASVILRDLFT